MYEPTKCCNESLHCVLTPQWAIQGSFALARNGDFNCARKKGVITPFLEPIFIPIVWLYAIIRNTREPAASFSLSVGSWELHRREKGGCWFTCGSNQIFAWRLVYLIQGKSGNECSCNAYACNQKFRMLILVGLWTGYAMSWLPSSFVWLLLHAYWCMNCLFQCEPL